MEGFFGLELCGRGDEWVWSYYKFYGWVNGLERNLDLEMIRNQIHFYELSKSYHYSNNMRLYCKDYSQ